jgi:hypothetical protein
MVEGTFTDWVATTASVGAPAERSDEVCAVDVGTTDSGSDGACAADLAVSFSWTGFVPLSGKAPVLFTSWEFAELESDAIGALSACLVGQNPSDGIVQQTEWLEGSEMYTTIRGSTRSYLATRAIVGCGHAT